MASSMSTGDRRCGTVRGKMTVLGKLPKPINLPSQRSENRGLDPNVEIVPKGTLTWGSRQPAAATNAWASSAVSLSPGDGSSSSPVSGRPSSGGSVPRPSTSSSDRSYDPTSNVWGSSSRPSSASGVLASNQISLTANRPRSAETRPGSSQLSRFAENSAENAVAWGPAGTSDRLGSAACKTSGFTLSSGDFPTLGSEKNPESQTQQGHSSQGRSASASGSLTQKHVLVHPAGDEKAQTDSENTNTWKSDSFPHTIGGVPPAADNWQRDVQQSLPYSNVNMPFHQFDTWHGPPVRSSDRDWYAGGTAGGAFRPPGPTGAFQIDHFAPYPAQLSAPFPNSQTVPRPGAGPGCFFPKNGDTYCPRRPPDSFIANSCPVIPLRPGVYPSPQPYEGYYGPHANFSNSMDGEVTKMGPSYNQYSRDSKVRPGKFHARTGAHTPFIANDQVKSGASVEYHQGQYKVLLKQHDGGNNEHEKREQSVVASLQQGEGRNQHEASYEENDWRANSRKDEEIKLISERGQFAQPANDGDTHSSNSHIMKPLKDLGEASNECLMNKQENAGVPVQNQKQYPGIKKSATLMEKIEVLNNKARIADGHDLTLISSRDRLRNPKGVKLNAESLMQGKCIDDNEDKNYTTCNKFAHNEENECDRKDIPSQAQVSTSKKSGFLEDGKKAHFQVQRKVQTMQNKTYYHVKFGSVSQVDDEIVKGTSGKSSSEVTALRENEGCLVTNLTDCHASQENIEKQELHAETIAAPGSYSISSLDPDEHKAQRAKLKEIASQRAKQLQEEEVERTREQKAKALAKLEELNRRTSSQSSNQSSNNARVASKEFQHKQDPETDIVLQTVITVDETPCGTADTVKPLTDNEVKNSGSANICLNVDSQRSKLNSPGQGSAVSHDESPLVEQDANNHENVNNKSANRPGSNFSKNKQMGYRRKQTVLHERSPGEQLVSTGNVVDHKNSDEVAVTELAVDSLPIADETPIHHRKKNNRTSRSRNKIDEGLSGSSSQSSTHNEGVNLGKADTDTGKTQSASLVETVPESVQAPNETSKNQCSGVEVTQTTEEQHTRVINQWKPQSSRRSTKNQLGNRSGDKFHGCDAVIWAPVRTQNKSIPSEDISHILMTENSDTVSGDNGHDTQCSMKIKRAEMERYVRKQAGKELSHPNSQQTSSSIDQVVPTDVTAVHDEVSGQKTEFSAVAKSGDGNKPNRRSKMHASWRQKNLAGFPALSQSSFTESVISSDFTGPLQREQEQHQSSELCSRTGEHIKYDVQKGTNDKLESAEPIAVPSHQSVASKRQLRYKVHRGSVNSASTDSKAFQGDSNDNKDTPSSVLEMNESGIKDVLGNENQILCGEQKKSHWQPKSQQPYSHHHRHGNKGTGNQRLASHGSRTGKEFRLHHIGNYPHETEDNGPPIRTGGSAIRNTYHQEAKQETKASADPTVQQRQLPNKLTIDEQTPKGNPQTEQLVSPSLDQRGQSNREREATYRGRDRGQDAGKQNYRFNRDKRKNSLQFEYQRIGSYDRPNDTYRQSYAGLEAQEGPRVPRLRYGEQGHNYARRGGHLYGRNSGTAVRVGDHNSGE